MEGALKHLFSVKFVPCLSSYQTKSKYIEFKLMQNQNLFHACSSIKDGESVELSGELMQEIHHVRYLKELEINL